MLFCTLTPHCFIPISYIAVIIRIVLIKVINTSRLILLNKLLVLSLIDIILIPIDFTNHSQLIFHFAFFLNQLQLFLINLLIVIWHVLVILSEVIHLTLVLRSLVLGWEMLESVYGSSNEELVLKGVWIDLV